jgi:ribosome recycling factor
LKHVASIAIEDARTLKVTPWKNLILKILKVLFQFPT